MSDDFIRDLELELTAAARRRATRAARAPGAAGRHPLPHLRRLLPVLGAGLLAIALITIVALLARGDAGDRAADQRRVEPPGGVTVPLLASLPPARCRELPVADGRAELTDLAVLRRPQRADDAIEPPQGNVITWLPVRSFDARDPRVAGQGRLPQSFSIVPSRGVPEGDRCGSDVGPGLCLVEPSRRFRCFPRADLARGAVLMRLSSGEVAGVVPDGISRVTVGGAAADVLENAYVVPAPGAGDEIRVTLHGDACTREISDALLDRVPILGTASTGPLPDSGMAAVRESAGQLDAIVEDAARPWGGGDGVAYWVVPAVSRDVGGECAPADGACLVALPEDAPADASCVAPLRSDVRWVPLPGERTMVLGFVDRDVSGMRVRDGMGKADPEVVVPARDGVLGGVAPFDGDGELFMEPVREEPMTVAVVDATFGTDDAERMRRRLERAGYTVRHETIPTVKPQEPTCVYWRDRADADEATALAELIVADGAERIEHPSSRPLRESGVDVFVEVGSAPNPPAPQGQRPPSC